MNLAICECISTRKVEPILQGLAGISVLRQKG
jgi:hypothetical protein